MIVVNVKTHATTIVSMEVSGHAEYDESGKDVVCAGVSSIAVGLLNALDQMAENLCDLQLQKNKVSIRVLKYTHACEMILRVGLIQLETIQESYKEYIQINKQEV